MLILFSWKIFSSCGEARKEHISLLVLLSYAHSLGLGWTSYCSYLFAPTARSSLYTLDKQPSVTFSNFSISHLFAESPGTPLQLSSPHLHISIAFQVPEYGHLQMASQSFKIEPKTAIGTNFNQITKNKLKTVYFMEAV